MHSWLFFPKAFEIARSNCGDYRKQRPQVIIDEQPLNPKYYDKMSELLDPLMQQRKEEALDYQNIFFGRIA